MSERFPWIDAILWDVRQRLEQSRRLEATYRLQFHPENFNFRDAAAIVPYLQRLGVSHVYASPYFKAHTGSEHGYAVVDYTQLDSRLGTPQDYEAFVAALREHDIGQILDVVPNHMSIAPQENRWWTDVLENGPSSPYADFFDIDWHPVKEELRNKILLPVLGQQFGEALEAGELKLVYDDGAFWVKYYERRFPVDPRSYPLILAHRMEELRSSLPEDADDLRELESIVTAAEHLPKRTERGSERIHERQREKEVIKDRLRRLVSQSSRIADFLEENLKELNGRADDPSSFDRLERILDAQAYRLSHWKAAADEINYRRFFDVNELAAVCMEDQRVFDASHGFIFELLANGKIDGLRIDHVDGLFEPQEYLWRLQWGYIRVIAQRCWERLNAGDHPASEQSDGAYSDAAATPPWEEIEPQVLASIWGELGGPSPFALLGVPAAAEGPPPDPPIPTEMPAWANPHTPPLYVVVEKILGPEEPLPPPWPVAGTTGYDFLNCVGGLFVDPAGLRELVKVYRRFSRRQAPFHEVAYRCKLLILRVAMASELYLLAHRLNRISERHRHCRDFTLNSLRTALREVLACFPVYRTYVGTGGVNVRDREVIRRAVSRAKRRNPAMDTAVFDFIQGVLLLEAPEKLDEAGRHERQFFVGRFQQATSPVMAKGVEDTAFYRYYPLVSANEVGSEPARAAVTLQQFHEENLWRWSEHPCSMTCTSTHDTKRSEDVRARISVLSQVPQQWRSAVNRWSRINRRFHEEVDGQAAPSRNDEYLLYQTLVGIWPLVPPDDNQHEQLIERLVRYMEKATREAKAHTSWISPDPEYDHAVGQFVRNVLRNDPKNRFLQEFRQFHEKILDCGLYTALSQVVLKLTSPGVPDTYQGQELWDFSLVDPDNRRPVDYALRERLLTELAERASQGDDALRALAGELATSPRDPRLKLFVTWKSLQFRRQHGDMFRTGRYQPLWAEGPADDCVCAFSWQSIASDDQPEDAALVVVPRLLARLTPPPEDDEPWLPPLGPDVWTDTELVVPESLAIPSKDLFTGRVHSFNGRRLPLRELLADFPVAVLTNR